MTDGYGLDARRWLRGDVVQSVSEPSGARYRVRDGSRYWLEMNNATHRVNRTAACCKSHPPDDTLSNHSPILFNSGLIMSRLASLICLPKSILSHTEFSNSFNFSFNSKFSVSNYAVYGISVSLLIKLVEICQM